MTGHHTFQVVPLKCAHPCRPSRVPIAQVSQGRLWDPVGSGEGWATDSRAPCGTLHFRLDLCLAVSKNGGMRMKSIAQALGRRGGLARARKLSPERRREIASQG